MVPSSGRGCGLPARYDWDMARTSVPRKLVLQTAIGAAFLAGAGSAHLWPRDAHAQAIVSLSTIYVPSDGLVFRALDGKPIAKLSRDGHGARFELYDDAQETSARLSRGAIGAARPPREPYVLDDDDPFVARPPARAARPAVGF
jgi:hypothetical protein